MKCESLSQSPSTTWSKFVSRFGSDRVCGNRIFCCYSDLFAHFCTVRLLGELLGCSVNPAFPSLPCSFCSPPPRHSLAVGKEHGSSCRRWREGEQDSKLFKHVPISCRSTHLLIHRGDKGQLLSLLCDNPPYNNPDPASRVRSLSFSLLPLESILHFPHVGQETDVRNVVTALAQFKQQSSMEAALKHLTPAEYVYLLYVCDLRTTGSIFLPNTFMPVLEWALLTALSFWNGMLPFRNRPVDWVVFFVWWRIRVPWFRGHNNCPWSSSLSHSYEQCKLNLLKWVTKGRK